MRRARSIGAVAVLVATIAILPRSVRAQQPDSGRLAAATVLFDEGVKLMEAGQTAEACPKLARSQELAPSGGTLLALGECYEKLGRVASAWLAFREAAARAASAGKYDAEAKANERASRLERRLSRISIRAPSGVEVKRDGVVLAPAELGIATPVDPGTHEVRASAPGKKPFVKVIDMKEGIHQGIEIPPLEPEGSTGPTGPPNPPVEKPPEPSDGSTQRILGLGLGGLGIVAIGVGTAFGVMASSAEDDAKKLCNDKPTCPPTAEGREGVEKTDDALKKARVSDVLFIVGGLAIVGGAALFFTAPSGGGGKSSSLRIVPAVGPTGFGGAATLRF
jgi:hypothetical protein